MIKSFRTANIIKIKLKNQCNLGIVALFNNVPFTFDWVEYKGEVFFAVLNFEKTETAKKPMIDLFFCATTALNELVLKTVQYDKNKFEYPTDLRN